MMFSSFDFLRRSHIIFQRIFDFLACASSVESTTVTYGPGTVNFTGINKTTLILPKKTDNTDVYLVIHNNFDFLLDSENIPAPVYKNIEEINLSISKHWRPFLSYAVFALETSKCDTVDFVLAKERILKFGTKFADVNLTDDKLVCIVYCDFMPKNYTIAAVNASEDNVFEFLDYQFANPEAVSNQLNVTSNAFIVRLTTGTNSSGIYTISELKDHHHEYEHHRREVKREKKGFFMRMLNFRENHEKTKTQKISCQRRQFFP